MAVTDLERAKFAHLVAEAVRRGDFGASYARRHLVQDLRRLNTNSKLDIRPRSVGAQAVIDKYAPQRPPANGSPDSLHADHYGMVTSEEMTQIASVEDWLEVIARVRRSVVCVTAAENYSLITWERQGHLGPEKYDRAGIAFVDPVPWDLAP